MALSKPRWNRNDRREAEFIGIVPLIDVANYFEFATSIFRMHSFELLFYELIESVSADRFGSFQ